MQRKFVAQKRFKEKKSAGHISSYSILGGLFLLIIVFSAVTWLVVFRDSDSAQFEVEVPPETVEMKVFEIAPDTVSKSSTEEILSSAAPILLLPENVVPGIALNTAKRNRKTQEGDDFHFVHIPKCGGTSMTTVLRQIACRLDPTRNKDCCTNPGFCDWHAMRRCLAIKGCINHFPNRKWIFKEVPSITIFREPISRLLSAFFYRGHSPNLDFFDVRPEAKLIKEGKRPKVQFDEYLDMHEYQNIITRMLGADSFPYRNITVDNQIYEYAKKALNAFSFIGIQEVFDFSVKVFLHEVGMANETIEIVNERDQGSAKAIVKQKNDIKKNTELMNKAYQINNYDVRLYKLAAKKFCKTVRKYPSLWEELKTIGPKRKFTCDSF